MTISYLVNGEYKSLRDSCITDLFDQAEEDGLLKTDNNIFPAYEFIFNKFNLSYTEYTSFIDDLYKNMKQEEKN